MTVTIGRRELLAALGGAAVAWPVAARAQQPAKAPTIGFLGTATPSTWGPWTTAFLQRLRELGWIEGRNVAIEYRWAEGRTERFAEIAAEFVRLKVDVIAVGGSASVVAAKQATSVIPIVTASVGDPLGSGLVESLARPGGNVTGLSLQQTDLATKRLELLHELVPDLHRLAIMAHVASAVAVAEMLEVQAAAKPLGLEIIPYQVRRAEDIGPAIDGFKGRADALYICTDPLLTTHRVRIAIAAVGARLPTIHNFRDYIEAGGLMSYGPNLSDLFRRSADYVDKILRGAKPGEIPIEQPTKFDLVINLTTAKALESHDGQSAWSHHSGVVPAAGRRGDRVRRREFITLLGGAAAWPLAGRAPQAAMPVIGFLHIASLETRRNQVASFYQVL